MFAASRSVHRCCAAIVGALPLLLAACAGASPEQTRAATVAEVGGEKLAGAPLERWLLRSPYRPTRRAAEAAISTWIDETALATALQKGPAIDDSATVDAAILPDAERGTSREYWKTRADGRPPVTDRQADSVSSLDRVRIFQRLLIAVPPNADTAVKRVAALRARSLLKRIQGGADFTSLIREASQDTAKANGGYLPGMTRAEVPPQIAGVVWALHPGEFSPLLETPIGVQILRRATVAESRPGLRAWLTPIVGRRADSLFLDSVATARHFTVTAGALARFRALAEEPVNAPDGPPLVTWDGGAITPALARKWMLMVIPAERGQMAIASDSNSNTYLRELGQRELIIGLAGGTVTPKARLALVPVLRRSLATVEGDLTRVGGKLPPAQMGVAYLDSVTTGTTPFRMLPGALGAVLRSRYPVQVESPALDAVVKLAAAEWDLKRAADTTTHTAPVRRP